MYGGRSALLPALRSFDACLGLHLRALSPGGQARIILCIFSFFYKSFDFLNLTIIFSPSLISAALAARPCGWGRSPPWVHGWHKV